MTTVTDSPANFTQVANHLPDQTREAAMRVLEGADDEVRVALTTRLLNALADVLAGLREEPVAEVVAAPTDREALMRALAAAPAPEPRPEYRRAELLLERARLRGIEARDRIVAAEGGQLTAQQAAQMLRTTRQTVHNRRNRGTLLGLKFGRRGYTYPAWQFNPESGTLLGLERVLPALGERDPLAKAAFMLNRNARLDDRRPLDLLREGKVEAVVRAAEAYGEQGGS